MQKVFICKVQGDDEAHDSEEEINDMLVEGWRLINVIPLPCNNPRNGWECDRAVFIFESSKNVD